MLNYIHSIPTQLYFGEGQISHLSESLAKFGKNVLLTYGGGSIKKTGLYDTIMNILNEGGFNVVELSGIEPNPKIESIEKGVALCKENNVDVVLAVGGGSTIDCSKAICTGVFYEGDLWEMCSTKHGKLKALPLVDVLTLSATGSEFDGGAVISNMKINRKLGNTYTHPSVSICDPTYTYTVNAYQTAAGSADIMSHVFENYFSRTYDSDLSEAISEGILKSVMKNCPIALKDPTNYSARANLMACANVACSGIPLYGKQATGWPAHAMEHELSAFYDITHGVGLAIVTPRWMRYILAKDPTTTAKFATFARNVMGLTGDDEAQLAKDGIDALEAYFKSTGIPMTLTELNIGTENIRKMAEQANTGNKLANAFVPLTVEDIEEIYKACL